MKTSFFVQWKEQRILLTSHEEKLEKESTARPKQLTTMLRQDLELITFCKN